MRRYDWWDRDRGEELSIVNALQTQVVVGASYMIEGTVAKFAVNLVRQDFPNADNVRPGTILLAGFSGVLAKKQGLRGLEWVKIGGIRD